MKRSLIALALFVFVAVLLLTVRVPQPVLGKAHVPQNRSQVCHRGKTFVVTQGAVNGHLAHGDCRLPVCDFANVFMAGADCSGVGPADGMGRCTNLNPRQPWVGGVVGVLTPACTIF